MDNFTYHIPTQINFGRGQIKTLPDVIKKYGNKLLLVYGGGTIKKIGLYDALMKLLQESGIEVYELSGVEPNPRVTTVDKGVKIVRENGIQAVLAAGGGSTIDCAKAVAACQSYDGPAWDVVSKKVPITTVLPIFTVLTTAATGSEMDTSAVISNLETNEKMGVSNAAERPTLSILDPEYTFSLSKFQTACGVADSISHAFEDYFNNVPTAFLQSRFSLAVLETIIKYAPIAYEEPENYEARANLMWASSWAINGLCKKGCTVMWSMHPIEHQLSAYYDITHGAGLAVIIPHWMRYMLRPENSYRFVDFGVRCFGLDPEQDAMTIANQAIEKVEELFFEKLHLPKTLREAGVPTDEMFRVMAERCSKNLGKAFVPMTADDVFEMLKKAY